MLACAATCACSMTSSRMALGDAGCAQTCPIYSQVLAGSAAAPAAAGGAQPGGRLQSEVLAMCGVDAPLRRLDLAGPVADLARLDVMDCPLEGINCLQVHL